MPIIASQTDRLVSRLINSNKNPTFSKEARLLKDADEQNFEQNKDQEKIESALLKMHLGHP